MDTHGQCRGVTKNRKKKEENKLLEATTTTRPTKI